MKEKIKENSKKNNKKELNNKKKIFLYIFLFIISIYLIYTIYLLAKQPTDIFVIEKGNVSQEETVIGYIIREEKVVKGNNYANGMEQIKAEGEKTAKGESIYRYYSKNEEELTSKIAELDSKIQETLSNQKNVSPPDIKLIIENQLDEKIELLNTITDVSKLVEYKKEINNLITKKAKSVGELSAAGAYLKQLYEQRANLENELNSGAEYITSTMSGVVSYRVDGLEDTLTPNSFSTLSKDYLEKLNLKTGKIIATNNECGKIINNFEAYIATISNSIEAKEAQIGKKVKIRLANNKIIEATIEYLSQENEDDVLMVLRITQGIEELINYRKISFDLIWWSNSGLKVPNQAIIEENNISYVVRNRAGYLTKIPVNIKQNNSKYAIINNYSLNELKELGLSTQDIKTISIYDEIIINPDLSKIE